MIAMIRTVLVLAGACVTGAAVWLLVPENVSESTIAGVTRDAGAVRDGETTSESGTDRDTTLAPGSREAHAPRQGSGDSGGIRTVPPDPGPVICTGLVVDPRGKPVGGARPVQMT